MTLQTNDEKDISIKRYSLVKADHPSNAKWGGVCIYYKESLGVHIIDIPNLTESTLCQVTITNKMGYVILVYQSPSQSSDDFENVLSSFDQVIIIQPSDWWYQGISTVGQILGWRVIFPLKKVLI